MSRYALLAVLIALSLAVPAALAVYPGDPGFRGCVISNADGAFADVDCDSVPDVLDNCPLVGNPVQSDVDGNGLGDTCDLVIDEIVVEPQEPMQGRSMIAHVGVFNNRPYPMRNLVVKIEVPRLGLSAIKTLPIVQPGERILDELLVRIPECAPTRPTDIVAIVEYPIAPGQKEVFSGALRVPVVSSGTCPHDGGEELTVVNIIELQDVDPELGAIYPFTITNNWPESKAYVLSVQGTEPWGTAAIEPGSVIVVPAGGTREGALLLFAYPGQTGDRSFTLSVNARDDAKQVVLRAELPDAPAPVAGPALPSQQLLYGLAGAIALILLIALVVIFMRHKHREGLSRRIRETNERVHPGASTKGEAQQRHESAVHAAQKAAHQAREEKKEAEREAERREEARRIADIGKASASGRDHKGRFVGKRK